MAQTTDLPTHLFDLGHQGDVDRTLLAMMLSKSPLERLRHNERWRSWLTKKGAPMSPFMEDVIQRLVEGQCEFLVVGGVSALLQGASIMTFDLDVCYRRTPASIARLVGALAPLSPRPRGFPPDLPYVFDERTVQLGCNFTLQVGEEALDLLGDMAAIGGYEQVITRAVDVSLGSVSVKVLSLQDLIATKSAANRPKDLIALPILQALLEVRKQHPSA